MESVVESSPEIGQEAPADGTAKRRRFSLGLGWLLRFRYRRLFQFRLTSLLWMILVLSILLAWWRDHQQLLDQIYAINNPGPNWGPEEATGPPNTMGSGDMVTAWASQTQDGQKEWLILEYENSVVPTAVLIHETYNPGAVYRVSAVGGLGIERVLWEGTDPTPTSARRGVSNIPISSKYMTNRIKVYIHSPKVPGWNEIDAVGLVDTEGNTQWASTATASSTFAQQFQSPIGFPSF